MNSYVSEESVRMSIMSYLGLLSLAILLNQPKTLKLHTHRHYFSSYSINLPP